MRRAALVAFLVPSSIFSPAVSAQTHPQNSRPEATARTDTIPAPRDIAYPGTLQLTVDASDVTRGIFRVREHVPVAGPGDFVLLYPKWIPGGHSPTGEIEKVAGFRASAGGHELSWARDKLDVTAFHVTVPQGVTAIDVEFQFLTPTESNQGRKSRTAKRAPRTANSLIRAVSSSAMTGRCRACCGTAQPSTPV